jgi:Cu/Zn superoxide dismutase
VRLAFALQDPSGRLIATAFATAGGIFNPFGKQHGLLNTAGPMAGDVPSLVIGPAGVGAYNTAAPAGEAEHRTGRGA